MNKLADRRASRSVLITGGTGSFGSTFARHLLDNTLVREVVIFSRDEYKQDLMRKAFNNDERLRFVLGDIRSYESVVDAVQEVDHVFHAAAMKQVPSCEDYPFEAVQTNIVGSMNLIKAARRSGSVEQIVFLSTDKAVQPVNAMGASKMMMEKIVLAESTRIDYCPKMSIVRYGNVMCSRGSVIPLFVEKFKNQDSIPITDAGMTRFLLSLEDAVNLVEHAFADQGGGIYIRKAPACTVGTLYLAMAKIFDRQTPYRNVGIRPGEKIHETLATAEELSKSKETDDYFHVHPSHALDGITEVSDYSSDMTTQLTVDEVVDLLLTNREFIEMTKGML